MGSIRPYEDTLLFAGALFSNQDILLRASLLLKDRFGPILYEGPVCSWNYSSYYDDELGVPIFKSFIFFDSFIDPSYLTDAKLITNEIEAHLSLGKKRQINIDPGCLSLSKIVLASTKNYSHRIYLGKGIYGEVALFFKEGVFCPMPNAYHDYRQKEFIDIFLHARHLMKEKIKEQKGRL